MKRILFLGLMLTVLGTSSAIAQDDIYYNSSDAKKDAANYSEPERRSSQSHDRYDDGTYQSEYTDNNTVSTDESNDYVDYSDDSYAGRFRRFNSPMWGMGYYNSFYNPYWYDPFWGGWGYTPGWSVTIGTGWGWGGGPYWSSGWGLNTWYGYPGFYSAWNSPYCGGWGGGYYGWGGYGMGYWNGYYAGLYGSGLYTNRVVNYGPRYSSNGLRNNNIVRSGNVYTGGRNAVSANGGDRRGGLRMAGGDNNGAVRGNAVRQDAVRQDNVIRDDRGRTANRPQVERPARGSFFSNDNNSVRQPDATPMQNTRPTRSYGQRSQGGGRTWGAGNAVPSRPAPSRSEGRNFSGSRNEGGRSFGNSNSGSRSFNSGSSGGSRSFGGSNSGGSRSFGGGGGRAGGRR